MVLQAEPIIKAIRSILNSKFQNPKSKQIPKLKIKKTKIILFTPAGKQFDAKIAQNFASRYDHIIMIAGRYEGVDHRIYKVLKNMLITHNSSLTTLSIGPYVLTGGELPALIMIDAISRHIPGVLGKNESLEEKRGGAGIPAYTRPEKITWNKKTYAVPKILLSGNHKKIAAWLAAKRASPKMPRNMRRKGA